MEEGTREPWSRMYVRTTTVDFGGTKWRIRRWKRCLCFVRHCDLSGGAATLSPSGVPASTSIMFLSAWLTSKPTDRGGGSDGGGTGDAAAATADVRANRIRSRAGRQDDGSALRHTKRRRKGDVVAPGSGSGSGSGSGGNSAAQPRVKISIPKAGGYDKLQLVEFGSGATSGPNLTTEDEDSLVVVSTSFVGINYADICVRYVTCPTRFHTYLTWLRQMVSPPWRACFVRCSVVLTCRW